MASIDVYANRQEEELSIMDEDSSIEVAITTPTFNSRKNIQLYTSEQRVLPAWTEPASYSV